MTRSQLKDDLRINLADVGITFFSEEDLEDSIQDAYDDIVSLTQCIQKNVTLSWIPNLVYYNFKSLLADYLGTTAIFNTQTNMFLRDDLNLRNLDQLRRDWEMWVGAPQYWVSSDPDNIVIVPHYIGSFTNGAFFSGAFSSAFFINGATASVGTYKLFYWATAPVLSADSDSFLLAADFEDLLEFYVTGDMLEQAEEFTKASEYWDKYYNGVTAYKDRVKRVNKSDLLLRI